MRLGLLLSSAQRPDTAKEKNILKNCLQLIIFITTVNSSEVTEE